MATRRASTRRNRRPARKAPAPSRLGRIAAAPLLWARRPVRMALTATLVGYGLAEAAWQARPAIGTRASR